MPVMRKRNWRVVIVGVALVFVAIAFYLGMLFVAPKSNDPAALMQIVGTVAGVVCGLALVMIIFGLIGKSI